MFGPKPGKQRKEEVTSNALPGGAWDWNPVFSYLQHGVRRREMWAPVSPLMLEECHLDELSKL